MDGVSDHKIENTDPATLLLTLPYFTLLSFARLDQTRVLKTTVGTVSKN